MDTVKFVIEDYADTEYGFRFPTINIYINDRNLIDLVSEVERLQWESGERSRPSYIGFQALRIDRFRNEMLAAQKSPYSILLTCTCTIELCDSIMAKIAISADTVTWTDLKSLWGTRKVPASRIEEEDAASGWARMDYSCLGPFVFERKQYLAALDALDQEWHTRRKLENLSEDYW